MPRTLEETRAAQRRTVWATTLFVVFVCVSLLGVDLWLALRARNQELRSAALNNANLASAVAQQMDGLVSEVGHLLDGIAFEFEAGTSQTAMLAHLKLLLKNHAQSNKHIHGIFYYGPQGEWLANSQDVFPPNVNNADRDYFIHHRADPALTTWVSQPVISRSTGVWIIPISRRLNDQAGNFAGVLLATIDMAHVSQLLSRFKIGEQGSLTFNLLDGTVLVRRPLAMEFIGKKVVSAQLQRDFLDHASGSFEILSPIDGVERLGSFQRADNHPLLVTVALSKEELLQAWRETTWLQTLWILVLCAVTALSGTYVVRAVRQRVRVELRLDQTRDELTQANTRLAQLASYDGLTGLANRRHFDDVIERSFAESCRSGHPLGLVMIDVDHFKQYNDLYGHPEGDRCLQQVANAIQGAARRPLDFVARYGGEEMVMVLPNTDGPGGWVVAEAARLAVAAMEIPHAGNATRFVSVSAGVAVYSLDNNLSNLGELIEEADQALYRAKHLGRNRVLLNAVKATAQITVSSTQSGEQEQ